MDIKENSTSIQGSLARDSAAAAAARLGARIQAGLPVSLLELGFIAALFAALWAGLAVVAGGPLYSDELWYIQVGLNELKAVNVLNRYFHIYLQKFFMELAPSPELGVRIFWGFLVSLTASLTYLTARLLGPGRNLIHGLSAVAIFFSFQIIGEYSGITIVDITAMAMMAVMIFVYLIAVRFAVRSPWPVVLMGFLFFLGMKTKETNLIAGVLLLGFGFDEDGRFDVQMFGRRLIQFGAGVAAGILFFILLNTIVLREPLFGLTPAYFMAFGEALSTTEGFNPEAADWYTGYLLPVLPTSFLLYLLSGARQGKGFSPAIRLIWLVPLFLILFLSFSMIRGDWGIRARHLFPILPVLSLLAPQFMEFELPSTRKGVLLLASNLGLGLVVFLLVRFGLIYWVGELGGDVTVFLSVVVFPIVFSLLLAVILWCERFTVYNIAVPLLAIGLVLYSPLFSNVKSIFVTQTTARHYEMRVRPLAVFADQIAYQDGVQILISYGAAEVMRNPSGNSDVMLSLFNFYFDAGSTRENFTHQQITPGSAPEILKHRYDYVLLTGSEWSVVLEDPESSPGLDAEYKIHSGAEGAFVLLERRE